MCLKLEDLLHFTDSNMQIEIIDSFGIKITPISIEQYNGKLIINCSLDQE